jgi:hypothetical protein
MGTLDRLRALFGRSPEPEPESSAAAGPETEHEIVHEGHAKAHDLGMTGQVASQGSPTGVPSLAYRPITTDHGSPPTDETAEIDAERDQ